jgi:hypothetical protein
VLLPPTSFLHILCYIYGLSGCANFSSFPLKMHNFGRHYLIWNVCFDFLYNSCLNFLTWNVIREWSCQGRVRCKMWPRHAVTSYHVIHAAQVDDATILHVTAFLRHRLKTMRRERRRPYNISCCNVLSRRLETMEARSADFCPENVSFFWKWKMFLPVVQNPSDFFPFRAVFDLFRQMLTDVQNIYKSSRKSIKWEPRCSTPTDGQPRQNS